MWQQVDWDYMGWYNDTLLRVSAIVKIPATP